MPRKPANHGTITIDLSAFTDDGLVRLREAIDDELADRGVEIDEDDADEGDDDA